MPDLALAPNTIPAMSQSAIATVRELEQAVLDQPQIQFVTEHLFHAGMYARTVWVPAGVVITGALIKIPTVLIVSGDALMYGEDGAARLTGYTVFAASADRKQAFVAVADTHLTMLFPTQAKTVAEAEAEFTAETDLLVSRRDGASNVVEVGQ